MSSILEFAIVRLLTKNPGYAFLLQQMKRIFTNEVEVAGVSVTTHINLYINIEGFKKFNFEGQEEILIHECLHILNLHITRQKDKNHKKWNIATDIAINHGLEEISKVGMTAEKFKLKEGMHAEYYYANLPESKEQPDHGKWAESDEFQDIAESVIKEAIEEAIRNTEVACGKAPADFYESIKKINGASVKWERELRKFSASCVSLLKTKSRMKRNRRYGIIFPGKKRKWKSHIVVVIDSSGSVSDESLSQFLSEISNIHKGGTRVTMIEADAKVQKCYEYKGEKEIKICGRGGTLYQPAFDKANELKPDGLIYFGDMDSADKPMKPKYKVIWAIVGNSKAPGDFGKSIKVQVRK